MKPIFVRFRCFGPYIEEETISFEALAESGLFLICGETGSGKTTILDAMCCALYGSCSGEIRGELEAMRCRQAGSDEPTEVEFIFECGGRTYCFMRKLTPRKSRKADTAVTFNEDYSCRVKDGGVWVPLLDHAKKKSMNAKAEKLIGLNLDQFRQVIILPQGRFETLLTSGSEEKESILSSLFHTERWKTAVEKMADEMRIRGNEIGQESQILQGRLKALETASVSELPEMLRKAGQEAEAAAQAKNRAEKEKQQAQALLELKNEYAELDRRWEKLETAKRNAANDPALRTRLKMAMKAEKARRPHEEWEHATGALKQVDENLRRTEADLGQAEAKLKQAEAALKVLEARAEEQQKLETEVQRLAALRERYQNIGRLQREAETAKKRRDEAEKNEKRAKDTFDRESEQLRIRLNAWNAAGEAYQKTSRAYQAATIGHLAASLREGEACPVCGSKSHPCPAALPEGAATGRDVEEAEAEVSRTRRAYQDQEKKKGTAETAHREAEQALKEAVSVSDGARAALNQELAQRDPELATLEDLERRGRQLSDAIREYRRKKEGLEAEHRQAEIGFRTLTERKADRQKQQEEARKEHAEKEAAWQKALAETGLGNETQYSAMILDADRQDALRKMLSDHAAALKSAGEAAEEQQAKVEGKERPDFAAVDQICRDADSRLTEAIRIQTLAEQKREHLKTETEELTKLDAALAEKRDAYEADSAFVKALRGSTGMSLQRYVLSVRLGQVILEANRLLSGIYGGRYRLHRSDESYGSAHKSGLELEVYDSLSDQRRSVCTLSGGEKFLVALSLAIGLCTVVQNEQRGVSLEAMFIDEGFGSLDQNTLGDALEVLQSIQRGRGMVGIISHVSLLEETIPTKIEIVKTTRGSRIRKTVG